MRNPLKIGHVSGYRQRDRARLCAEVHPEVAGGVWTPNVVIVVLTRPGASDYPRMGEPHIIADIPLCQACADGLRLGSAVPSAPAAREAAPAAGGVR